MVHIGQTTVPVYNPENRTKVPDVLFYENQQVRIPVRKSRCLLLQRERRRVYAMHAMLCVVILGSVIFSIIITVTASFPLSNFST